MQVFNVCFKIIKKNIISLMIYLLIFVFLILLLTLFYQAPSAEMFKPTLPRIAIFNEDKDDPFTAGFIAWLEEKTSRVDIEDEKEKIQDAIFYRYVNYILRIPDGFGKDVLSGEVEQLLLERTQSPDNWSGVTTDLLIERYVNLSVLLSRHLKKASGEELTAIVRQTLMEQADLKLQSGGTIVFNRTVYYFIYLAYSMMAVIILGITSILMVFNKKDLRQRNLSSPLNLVRFNAQLVLACLVFSMMTWLLMILISLVMGGYTLPAWKLVLLAANALAYTMACLSLSFLLSQFVRTQGVQQSMANVLALGTCFISGVFVPQELLGDTVQTLASFTPTYWYVRSVNEIDQLTQFMFIDLRQIMNSLLIQLGFAAALLIVAMGVIHRKRQSHA